MCKVDEFISSSEQIWRNVAYKNRSITSKRVLLLLLLQVGTKYIYIYIYIYYINSSFLQVFLCVSSMLCHLTVQT